MAAVAAVDEVVVREQDGDAFLLHVPSGKYFGLNKAGLVVWEALVAGQDPVQALAQRWPAVPAERSAADAQALVAALIEAGLARPATV